MNELGHILNVGKNFEDQEGYGVTAWFYKIAPIVIDEIFKKKWMNMQQENLISERDIENTDK